MCVRMVRVGFAGSLDVRFGGQGGLNAHTRNDVKGKEERLLFRPGACAGRGDAAREKER